MLHKLRKRRKDKQPAQFPSQMIYKSQGVFVLPFQCQNSLRQRHGRQGPFFVLKGDFQSGG